MDLSNLNKILLQNEIRALNYQCSELNTITERVEQAKKVLNADVWNQLKQINQSIAELEKILKKALVRLPYQKALSSMKQTSLKPF